MWQSSIAGGLMGGRTSSPVVRHGEADNLCFDPGWLASLNSMVPTRALYPPCPATHHSCEQFIQK